MKIYIAGKINGDPGYLDKFRGEAEKLEALGHIVLNPAALPEGMSKAEYMARTRCSCCPAGRAAPGRGWSRPIAATSESHRAGAGRMTHER